MLGVNRKILNDKPQNVKVMRVENFYISHLVFCGFTFTSLVLHLFSTSRLAKGDKARQAGGA